MDDIYLDEYAVDEALFAPGLSPGRRRELVDMKLRHAPDTAQHSTLGNIAYWMSHESTAHPPHGVAHPHSLARTAAYGAGGMPAASFLACRLPVVSDAEARRDLRAVRWGAGEHYRRSLADLLPSHPDPQEYGLVCGMILDHACGDRRRGVVRRWAERAHRRVWRYLAWARIARAAATTLLGRRGPAAATVAGACRD